jgi:hypothetical protein
MYHSANTVSGGSKDVPNLLPLCCHKKNLRKPLNKPKYHYLCVFNAGYISKKAAGTREKEESA